MMVVQHFLFLFYFRVMVMEILAWIEGIISERT